MVQKETILQALRGVLDMETGADIVSGGMVSGVTVQADGSVVFMLEVDPVRGPKLEGLRQEAERVVAKIPGVTKVTAVLTAEKKPQKEHFDPHGMVKNPKLVLPAKAIIAVGSGKGGVGKSTVAVNLAAALANSPHGEGLKVGLLDADIYGPSVPTMTGAKDYKPALDAQRKLVPLSKYNMKIMSIGFMVEAGNALVWRGPMIQTALYQLLRDVDWAMRMQKVRRRIWMFLFLTCRPGRGCATDAGAKGCGDGGGHRFHAAGYRVNRCAAGGGDVREDERAGSGDRREYEYLCLFEVRA